jgi:pimeloyl-ACP methyl ester carboxylesterase
MAILTLALLGAGLIGMMTESVLARGDDERYPIPGRVVAADQGALHLNCTGTGSPTVLLEAGLGEPGLTWAEVQDELDQHFTVCSYDRAGYGWSPAGAGAWEAEVASLQISQALRAADNNGPYVIAAHSVGSLVARELRHREPEAVAGMILLDPTNEVMLERIGTPGGAIVERTVMGALARIGIVRMFGDWLIPSFAGSPPPKELLDNAPAAYHPGAIAASTRELHGGPSAAAHLLAVEDSDWADLPLTVISAATTTQGDLDHHRDLASRSSAGRHLTAESGGHYIHYDDPQLVVDAICDVVSAATDRRNC